MAFQAYANNDLVDVDETDNVNDLKKKLKSDDRQVIVTTIQKMQILISKRLQEGTSEYNKIKNLKIAFVVDECHRAVTPKTKRELERFFGRSLWYGLQELRDLRRIHIRRWVICHVQQKNCMEKDFTNIQFKMQFMIMLYLAFR